MDRDPNLMDWESENPLLITLLMRSTPSDNSTLNTTEEWEPEIPGQFDTPQRIRRARIAETRRTGRKRPAAEAGFITQGPSDDDREPIMLTQTVASDPRAGSGYIATILTAVATTCYIIHRLFNATVYSVNATRRGVRAITQSQQVVEIRRMTNQNFISIKRRAAEAFTRPAPQNSQQLVRNGRQGRHGIKTKIYLSTHLPGNAPTNPNMSSQADSTPYPGVAQQSSAPTAAAPPPSDSPNLLNHPNTANDALPVAPMVPRRAESQAEMPVSAASPPSDSRRTLSNLSQATSSLSTAEFAAHPEEATTGSLATAEIAARSEAATTSSLPTAEIAAHTDVATTGSLPTTEFAAHSEEAITGSLPINEFAAHSEETSPYMELMQELLQKPIPSSSDKWIQKLDQEELNRLENFFTPAELPGRSHVDELPTAYQRFTTKVNLEKEISSNRKRLSKVNRTKRTPVRKNVRIALNPSTGLPREYVGRFYKESAIGQWASSPRSEDEIDGASADLNPTLALLEQGVDLSIPTMTPLNKPLIYPDSLAPGETPSYPLRPNRIFTPPDAINSSLPIPNPINAPYETSSLCQRKTGSFTEHIHETEDVSLPQYFDADNHEKSTTYEAAHQGVVNRENLYTEVQDESSRNTDSVQAEGNINDIILELAFNADNHEKSATYEAADQGAVNREILYTEVQDESSRNTDSVQAEENINDILLELAMSDHMINKIQRQRQERKAKEKALAAKRAEEAAAAKKAQAEAELKKQSQRRMPREKLVQPLTPEWQCKINEAMHKGDNIALTTTVNGTELTRKDFITVLGAQRWLNDEIINAYLEWVVEFANEKAGKNGRNVTPKVIAHNSFFYQNLATKGPGSVSRWMKRKKAEGKKLLDVECVLIPVNSLSHWTLIVVSPRQRTVEYLDSFGGDPRVFVSNTLAWLKTELGEDWREEEWRILETKSAQQTNGYDCGVFAVTNAECVVGGVATGAYSRHDMTEQRRRIAAVLLNRGFGGALTPAEEL